jgi:hypothetical protein
MRALALEQDKDAWLEDAVATIIGIAEKQPVFSADDLDREMRAPDSSKWPGAAFIKARAEGFIEGVEGDLYKKSSRPSRHHSAIKLWTKKKAERS